MSFNLVMSQLFADIFIYFCFPWPVYKIVGTLYSKFGKVIDFYVTYETKYSRADWVKFVKDSF